ncbi:MAG: DUF2269 family protein [Deltaproteobacteria bacterium]|nr:DUF2269 family protein [Deltaproteobacteria bacterium]
MKRSDSTKEALSKKKTSSSTARKWLKFIHIVFSMSWFGGDLSLILLLFFIPRPDSTSSLVLQQIIFIRLATIIVAPASVLSLITGLLLCWKSNWGFFRYWWVIIKLFVTILVIVFCIIISGPAAEGLIELSRTFGMEALHNEIYLNKKMLITIVQPVIFALLIFLAYLSVFKPWGKRKSKQ